MCRRTRTETNQNRKQALAGTSDFDRECSSSRSNAPTKRQHDEGDACGGSFDPTLIVISVRKLARFELFATRNILRKGLLFVTC